MKKVISLLTSALLILSMCSCVVGSMTPAEKLDKYMAENGALEGEKYVLDCPDAAAKIQEKDFTIAAMKNLKGAMKSEFKITKGADGITLDLVDSSITDGGMKMERFVTINPDGTFKYYNGMVMNGMDLGVTLEGEIPVETYNKETAPVITKSQLSTGAKLTDTVKDLMKSYINLTLDCYADVLAQEELGITMADMGYAAYPVAE